MPVFKCFGLGLEVHTHLTTSLQLCTVERPRIPKLLHCRLASTATQAKLSQTLSEKGSKRRGKRVQKREEFDMGKSQGQKWWVNVQLLGLR
jgi:hypothetical protein